MNGHGIARPGTGRFEVVTGTRVTDRLIARVVGVRGSATESVEFRVGAVRVDRRGRCWERWTRQFGGQRRSTTVSICGRAMVERVGPIELHFVLDRSASDRAALRTAGRLAAVGLRPFPVRVPVSARWAPSLEFTSALDRATDHLVVGVALTAHGGRTVLRYGGCVS